MKKLFRKNRTVTIEFQGRHYTMTKGSTFNMDVELTLDGSEGSDIYPVSIKSKKPFVVTVVSID